MGLAGAGQVLDGHTGVEHSLPVPRIYKDTVELFNRSQVGYTPTAIVGYGGLGNLLLSAVDSQFRAQVLAAGVLCVVLAIAFDLVLVAAQWLMTPWTRAAVR